MKALVYLLSLSLAGSAWAIDKTPAEVKKSNAVVVTVEADDNGEVTKNVKVIELTGDDAIVSNAGGDGHAIWVSAMADGDDQSAHDVKVLTHLGHKVDPNRGWLGVALSQSTESEDGANKVNSGVVVTNVVSDSPAERAGLLKDDIITAVNGEAVSGEVATLAKKIGELGPDAEVVFSILRDGQALDLTATLAPPKEGGIHWLHTPDFTFRNKTYALPHIGKLDAQGRMTILNSDDLDNLPQGVVQFLNNSGTSVQVTVEDGNRVIEIKNDDDGAVVELRQEGEGPISVKRYTEGSDDVTEAEYADAAALEAADPDAYEIYQQHQNGAANAWVGDDGQTYSFDFNVHMDPDNFDFSGMHEDLMKSFGNLHIDSDEMSKIHESLQDALGNMQFHFEPGQSSGFFGKATRTFKVQPNGTIEMTVRKGDTEVVTVFTDENDLAARDPEAFDRYDAVVNADVEE